MRVYREVSRWAASKQPLYLAIGNFDGVHLGHQKILSRTAEEARQNGGLSAVLTFSEHPRKVLGDAPSLLHSVEQKMFFLSKCGIDVCFLLDFTVDFSKLEAEEFAGRILKEALRVKKVFLGYNSRFGHDRKGDVSLMRKLAVQEGFEFESVPPVEIEGETVSSSRIRRLVEKGDFKNASACLGRAFTLFAKTVKGDGRGSGLGFPTANFDIIGRVTPPRGVYPAALREIRLQQNTAGPAEEWMFSREESWHPAAANLGFRPTFQPEEPKPVLEAFILDHAGGELYGKLFEVFFYPSIRAEKAFASPEELKQQIAKDVEASWEQFSKRPPLSSGLSLP